LVWLLTTSLCEILPGVKHSTFSHRIEREQRRTARGFVRSSALSTGTWAIVLIAALSSVAVLAWPVPKPKGRVMWTFAVMHSLIYKPVIDEWNSTRDSKIDLRLLGDVPLQRRMLAAFMAGLPSADLIEVERKAAARAFTGPLEAVGFVDLTDRLKSEGLMDQINLPSFSPWMSRGRIFGLPHDVHPVMLGYRADLVEAAGIDVSQIETWDDFARVMKPLQADRDGDGKPDRYLLNMWKQHDDHLEVFLLQAGGGFFDADGHVAVDTAVNAHVLAKLVNWGVGPDRICGDAPNFQAGGNKLKLDGYVVCSLMPDWMGDVWKHEIPQLKGKMKLMPMPAWEKGGRRTSVWGGTMIGIPKTAVKTPEDFEQLWTIAKELYISPTMARKLYEAGGIITPVRSFWSDPIFDRPSAYFSEQPHGRMYINLAPDVPPRTSSAYNNFAKARVLDAFVKLFDGAEKDGRTDVASLEAKARVYLKEAEASVRGQIERNVFLRAGEPGSVAAGDAAHEVLSGKVLSGEVLTGEVLTGVALNGGVR